MAGRISNWINERLPLKEVVRNILDEDIPGGASYFYTLGSATLFVFFIQVVSGIWQMLYYVPTTDHAYSSLTYLRVSVPYGWLIHGLHYWGAQAMIVLVGLHLIQVFIWGAYKKPREMTWLIGIFLLIMTAAMSFSGVLLPWDEVGYFAAQVGTNIASTFPLIGTALKKFMLGGTEMGQLTLSRFYVLHIAIIPAAMVIFIILHLTAFRKSGSAGPFKKEKHNKIGPFWPDQVYKDIVVSVLLLLILIAFTVYVKAPFTGPADLLDNSYHPMPEWNFLFLFQALKVFKGPLETVGTFAVPVLIVIFLFSIPFLDKNDYRRPMKRPLVMGLFFLFAAGIIVLTAAGKNNVPEVGQVSPSPVKIPVPADNSAQVKLGHSLFMANNCALCHSINGVGGVVGPDLSHETAKGRNSDWIKKQLNNPRANNPASVMPPFSMLSDTQRVAIATYLLNIDKGAKVLADSSKKSSAGVGGLASAGSSTVSNSQSITGQAASYVGNVEHGEILYRQTCEGCHGPQGVGGIPNPGAKAGLIPALKPISPSLSNKQAIAFVDKIDPYIQHGSTPEGTSPAFRMPDFGNANTLTQQQIAEIEAYVLSINGVDRAQILNPGMDPELFWWVSLGIFLLAGLILLAYWAVQKRSQ